MSFSSSENKQVEFNWRGSERTLERAPEGLELPIEMARSGRIDEGFRAFLDNKEENSRLYPPMETSLNLWGYALLEEEKYEDAIKVFTFNAELYPRSFNVYDSLGEAYMMNGDTDPAIENYRKSLELNPDNSNAATMLRKLGAAITKSTPF